MEIQKFEYLENKNSFLDGIKTLKKHNYLRAIMCLRKWKIADKAVNCNILQTILGIKLNFCLWLDIHIINKLTQLFKLGVVTHAWAHPKFYQILSQIHLKNELSYSLCELDFLILLHKVSPECILSFEILFETS